MASVYKVTATWNGFQGAPGYSKFAFSDLSTDTQRNAAGAGVRAFFSACASLLATSWTISILPEVQEYDMQTGLLVGAAVMTTPPTDVAGSSALVAYAGGSGACLTWRTASIYHGRRVFGRTFFVPLLSGFQSDGTLASATITQLTGAGNGLVALAGADFVVWAKRFDKTHEPPLQIDGIAPSVTSVTVKDAASQLRSRRL